MAGQFVISLDYELHWGFFDNRDLESCKQTLLNVDIVIDKLLELCDAHEVKITFATVGFLFAKDKDEILKFSPNSKPQYKDASLNPYALLNGIGNSEKDSPYYYASSGIAKIKAKNTHEIGTHTFSHYYCNEEGQTANEFEEDLQSAVNIAKAKNTDIKSIVFPRNQANKDYIKACQSLGLTSYRGSCWFNFNNKTKQLKLSDYLKILLRVLDTYINLTGSNSYKIEDFNKPSAKIVNVPSSRILRPYNPKFKRIEFLKIWRIKRSMTKAAKNGKIYHLWWHPHNFGDNMSQNFEMLKTLFEHYKMLNKTYGFKTATMYEIAKNFKA